LNGFTGVQAEADADSEAEDMVHVVDADSYAKADMVRDRREDLALVPAEAEALVRKVVRVSVQTDRTVRIILAVSQARTTNKPDDSQL
jgi:hypothetical protein